MRRRPRNEILVGDVRERLREIPAASVDCVITSPPYYLMRGAIVGGELGLEATVDEWAETLRAVLADIARVLKPGGSVWLNLGDTYSRSGRRGAPRKSLLLGPERLALGLLADGWLLRNKLIWAKRNPLPESVTDRLASTWEVVYFLTRSPRYFFDLDVIRVSPSSRQTGRPGSGTRVYPPAGYGSPSWGRNDGGNRGLASLRDRGMVGHPLGKNPGDLVWLPSASFRGGHFATFVRQLVERPLLATCPERVCASCSAPWRRAPHRLLGQLAVRGQLRPGCRCAAEWRAGLVLDPFLGSGTVALVAEQHERDWLGIELNPVFVRLAEQRLAAARGKPPVEQRDTLEEAAAA